MTTLGVDPASIDAAIVAGMSEVVALFDTDLRLVGVNQSLCEALGHSSEDLLGMSAIEVIAPGDQARAAMILGIANQQGAMAGAAPFGLLRADGSTVTMQITGADVCVGDQQLLMAVGRPTEDTMALGVVLDRLLANEDLEPVLAPLTDLFAWRLAGSGVAITWAIDGVRDSVTTGLPDELAGLGTLDPDGPWSQALHRGEPVLGLVDDLLEGDAHDAARKLGFEWLWVEPVATISGVPDATISVFTTEGGYSPLIHRYAVDEARRYLAVVLRWIDGLRRLEDAARRDDLTGLANRRAFFEALSTSQGGGAILFADLDGFKSVNDRWGHQVGDDVLSEAARRLVATVDPGVCVARVGGDEFAVILAGVTREAAVDIAEQIRRACAEPFDLHGEPIKLGISVGVAHDPDDLGAAALHAADRDQYADKRRRSTDL